MASPPLGNSIYKLLWGRYYRFDNFKSNEILGITYHKIEDTMVAAAEAMIESGQLPDLRGVPLGPSLTLYWNIICHPARAVKALLIVGGIPHNTVNLENFMGGQLS